MRRAASSKASLTERIYRSIREAILRNGLRPGAALAEHELGKKFGVSKTPVREALIRLAHEGFVTVSPRKGVFVATVSMEDLRELFAIRSALEGLACEQAAGRIPPQRLASLRKEFTDAARARNERQLFRLGVRLHELIIEAAGNKRLAALLETMRAQIARYSNMASQLPDQTDKSLRDHLRVIDALERGDGQAAKRLIQEHILAVKENLVRSML